MAQSVTLNRSRSSQSDRNGLVRHSASQSPFEALAEQHAIGQIGEGVMMRHVGDARLDAALLGDILVGRNAATVRRKGRTA